jgi:heterotetrameric sarcosine oxidase gamma subunit
VSSSPLVALSALDGIAVPGRIGRLAGAAAVTIGERIDLGLATVMVRKGRQGDLAVAAERAYGVMLPAGSRLAPGPKAGFIGTGPGQWFVVSETLRNGALARDLAENFRGLASISDQSDGRAVVRISGAKARDVLARGLPIDLDPRVFKPGDAATSLISYIGVQLWQVDENPTFDIAVFRGFAQSFWGWLSASAGEFGYEVSIGPSVSFD